MCGGGCDRRRGQHAVEGGAHAAGKVTRDEHAGLQAALKHRRRACLQCTIVHQCLRYSAPIKSGLPNECLRLVSHAHLRLRMA
jgi:hypothetical protein